MTKSLMEGSISYHGEANIYEIFSQAEDYPNKIFDFINPIVKDKVLVDLGCGTGKYVEMLSLSAKSIIWVDISSDQLKIASEKTKNLDNISFIHSSAETLWIESRTVDIVLWTWFLWTIREENRRKQVMSEVLRILKPWASIYLVENAAIWEFEDIRWKNQGEYKPTVRYNNWLLEQWFSLCKDIDTYFEFTNKQQAKDIIESIRGVDVAEKVKSARIEHKVSVYKYSV